LLSGLLILWLATAAFAEQSTIKWQSYQEGVEKIKKENKKGFLHFYTDWCTYCKLMNANTFTDKKVIDFLNENFVPILINAEKQQDVAQTYNANKFPFSVFIAEDISTIGSRPGYVPPDVMMDMLLYVQTNTYKTMTFNDFIEKKQVKKTAPPPEEPKM
jgi:thioredoxin-related protein